MHTLKHKTGTKTIFKPVALGEKQRVRYAVKAILESSKSQPGPLEERLAREFIAIVQEGSDDWGRKHDGKDHAAHVASGERIVSSSSKSQDFKPNTTDGGSDSISDDLTSLESLQMNVGNTPGLSTCSPVLGLLVILWHI